MLHTNEILKITLPRKIVKWWNHHVVQNWLLAAKNVSENVSISKQLLSMRSPMLDKMAPRKLSNLVTIHWLFCWLFSRKIISNSHLGDTTFENCYNTFGCANDCDASLTKIKGSLSAKAGREIAVGDMTLEQMVEWAKELPYDSVTEFKLLPTKDLRTISLSNCKSQTLFANKIFKFLA